MADDIVIRFDEGSSSPEEAAAENFAASAQALAEEMERVRRAAYARGQRRNSMGQFSGKNEGYAPRERKRSTSGGSGDGTTPPPSSSGSSDSRGGSGNRGGREVPPAGAANQGRKPYQFRLEGLFNLLRGGSNIRLRGIQQFTEGQIKDFFGKLKARMDKAVGTGGQGGFVNRSLARVGTTANSLGKVFTGLSARALMVGGVIAGVAAAAIGLTLVANKLRKAMSKWANDLLRDYGRLSPNTQQAQAMASISEFRSRFEAAQRNNQSLSEFVSNSQALRNEVREFGSRLFEWMSPLLNALVNSFTILLRTGNAILEWMPKIARILTLGFKFEKKPDEERRKAEQFNANVLNGLHQAARGLRLGGPGGRGGGNQGGRTGGPPAGAGE